MRILFIYKNSENLGIEYLPRRCIRHGHVTHSLWFFTHYFGFTYWIGSNGFNLEVIDQNIRDSNQISLHFLLIPNLLHGLPKLPNLSRIAFNYR